ncbi:MAG: hypothetical protein CSA18_03065 [Deltaproteobacteria bacterium]|nr:MAG: hypothetical protein CSA18_03065 [Deltaproteobacteria bacterium]
MNNSKNQLILGGILCFIFAIFQVAIGFSPSLSLYFGATESLVKNPGILIVVSLMIGLLMALFGLYGFSGAGKIVKLPWRKQILLGIGIIFFLRGFLLLPEILVVLNLIDSTIPVTARFIYFSIGALFIGVIFIKGNYRAMGFS